MFLLQQFIAVAVTGRVRTVRLLECDYLSLIRPACVLSLARPSFIFCLLCDCLRVRHVPRQSSAVNLGTRVGPAELKRLAAECEGLRAENRRLEARLMEGRQVRSWWWGGGAWGLLSQLQ